jgi:imidazolonepropionase-like amidohydrolase
MDWIKADRGIIGDGKTVLSPIFVGIENSKIAHVTNVSPQDLSPEKIIDIGDVTLTPGLINCHEHVFRKSMPWIPGLNHGQNGDFFYMYNSWSYIMLLALNWSINVLREQGVCLIRDMGLSGDTEPHALKKAFANGVFEGPDLQVCGYAICKTGGHAYKRALEVDGVDEVIKAVRKQCKAGSNFIKLMGSGGTERYPDENPIYSEFTQAELDAAVQVAHDSGVPLAIHAYSKESIMRALKAGIDSIEHGALMDEECIELMVNKGTYFCPTMIGIRLPFKDSPHYDELCRDIYPKQINAMQMAKKAGVQITIGTDTRGYVRDEIRLVAEALNETPVEVFERATRISAIACGRDDLGLLEAGKTANIVAFKGNLVESLDRLDDVVCVWKNGKRTTRTN